MGNSKSKDTDKRKNDQQKDDKCIGNRRVRTILLSILIAAFMVFAAPLFFDVQDIWRKLEDANSDNSQNISHAYYSTSILASGVIITLVGAVCAVVLFFIPNCDTTLGRVAGFILVIGGLLYMVGGIWYAVTLEDMGSITNEWMWAQIGETLLPGGSALMLGLDAAFKYYENESARLGANLGLFVTVSSLCMGAYYAWICEDDDLVCESTQPDGVEAIATGYAVIFVVSLVYVILYMCTCCTCDCKDACLVRVAIAIALVIGGVLTAIGYYVFSGGVYDATVDLGSNDIQGKQVAFYVGYTVLIGGLCCIWALDMACDDFKNR